VEASVKSGVLVVDGIVFSIMTVQEVKIFQAIP
jgi:hypothetical protein